MMILGKLHLGWAVSGCLLAFCCAMIFILARALLNQERRISQLTTAFDDLRLTQNEAGDDVFACEDRLLALDARIRTLTQRQDFLEASKTDGTRIESAISLMRSSGGDESILKCLGLNSGEKQLLKSMHRSNEGEETRQLPRQLSSLRTLLGKSASASTHPKPSLAKPQS